MYYWALTYASASGSTTSLTYSVQAMAQVWKMHPDTLHTEQVNPALWNVRDRMSQVIGTIWWAA